MPGRTGWPTALAGLGVGVDDFVGLHLHNGAEFVEAMVALYKLRAVPVNVNYRYTADELRYLFRDAAVRRRDHRARHRGAGDLDPIRRGRPGVRW